MTTQEEIEKRRRRVGIMLFSWQNDSYSRLKEMIAEADVRIEREGLANPTLEIEWDRGYYNGVDNLRLELTAYRFETDEEVRMKIQSEMTAEEREIERLQRQLAEAQARLERRTGVARKPRSRRAS